MELLNRQTFVQARGSSKKYPIENWIPIKWKEGTTIKEMTLPKCDKKYWKIVDEKVVEMTKTEKTAVDKADAEAAALVEKQSLIDQKKAEILEAQAIEQLKNEGILDSEGELVK